MKNRKIILAAAFLFFYAQYIYIPFQTTYLTALGASAAFVGIVTGAYGGAQLVLRLPVGVLADRVGKHKIFLVTGMLLAGAACGVRTLFPDAWGFFFASLLSGVSASTWLSFMVMYSECYGAREQQKASGRIVLSYNSGILAAFITGTLFYEKVGMRTLCVFGIIVSVIGVALCSRLCEGKTQKIAPSVPELLKICTNRYLIFFSVLALVQQGIQMATTMSFTTQILKNLGAQESILGLSSIIYMISSVVSSFVASLKWIEKKSSRFWIATIFTGLSAYCFLVPSVGYIPLILLLQLIPGLASGFLFSILTTKAMSEVPAEKKSTAMGFFQAVYAVGMSVFPILTGNIAEIGGMIASYRLMGVFALICVLATVMLLRNAREG